MLEAAVGFRADVVDGRFVIDARHQGSRWEVTLISLASHREQRVTQSDMNVDATIPPCDNFSPWLASKRSRSVDDVCPSCSTAVFAMIAPPKPST